MKKKMTFALCFCNRGFMPGELIYGARDTRCNNAEALRLWLQAGAGGR